MEAIFSRFNPKTVGGFLHYNMPESFIKNEHGLRDIIIDWTELQQPWFKYTDFLKLKKTHILGKPCFYFLQMERGYYSLKYILV